MEDKTNAMRLLDGRRLLYTHRSYPCKEAVSGVEAAKLMQLDPAMVYKTLVTVGKSKAHYVFVIPVAAELDLKKAAKCANEKSIAMIPMKELLPLTGHWDEKAFPHFCAFQCPGAGQDRLQRRQNRPPN